MPKLLCKPKHRVVIEDKSNIFYEIDYDNFDAVFFGESKKSLKMCSDYTKHLSGNAIAKKKKMNLQNTVQNQIRSSKVDQKKVNERKSRFISRKIKETIYSFKDLITTAKFPTCFRKYGCLIYDSSY